MDSDELFRERLLKQRRKRRNQIIRRVSLFSILLASAVFLLLYALTNRTPVSAENTQETSHTWEITQYADASGAQAAIYTVVRDDGKLAVIDGGWDTNADALREILASLGNHVDTWILTHPHKDHIGAFNVIYPDPQGTMKQWRSKAMTSVMTARLSSSLRGRKAPCCFCPMWAPSVKIPLQKISETNFPATMYPWRITGTVLSATNSTHL